MKLPVATDIKTDIAYSSAEQLGADLAMMLREPEATFADLTLVPSDCIDPDQGLRVHKCVLAARYVPPRFTVRTALTSLTPH